MSQIVRSYEALREGGAYRDALKLFRKGIFFVAVAEEAFALSERYGLELTKLSSSAFKAGFPVARKAAWESRMAGDGLRAAFFEPDGSLISELEWSVPLPFDPEKYARTKEAFFLVSSFRLNEASGGNRDFQLRSKIEAAYREFQSTAVRMPKKERFYFREKSERLLLDCMEDVYRYSYDPPSRPEIARKLSIRLLVFREFVRFAFDSWMGIPAGTYLSIGRETLSALKILKTLRTSGTSAIPNG